MEGAQFQEKYTRIINSKDKLGRNSCSFVKSFTASERERLRNSKDRGKYFSEVSRKDRASILSKLRTEIKEHVQ
jgi:hypothetical protein